MENNKLARIVVRTLSNNVFQFPIAPEFKITVELDQISVTIYDQLYQLFNDNYRLTLVVQDINCTFEGDFVHFEYLGKNDSLGVNCLIQISNITDFAYSSIDNFGEPLKG